MKNAFFALILTLVSSSAFAQFQSTCETNLLINSTDIKAEARAFVNYVEEMSRTQVSQDGVSSISGDTWRRADKAHQIVEMVTALEQRSSKIDSNLLADLCDANLNVMEALSR